ncbi:MAG: cysA [Phycisphaerales bacterium]|nr:cysA [Phycisphaerales bacterium]
MIRLENVSIRAGAFAVAGLSLEVPAGRYGVLMGQTGSGKTTLLEAICGLRRLQSGRITLGGRDVTTLKVAQRGIGYVPQDRALFPTMTVREHLAFALTIRMWNRSAIHSRVTELAQMLAITPLLDRGVVNLSGGEAQRVALGRALAHRPEVLLLDEPLSALDEETRSQMTDLLRSIQQETGVTMLHVTHSAREAERLAQNLFTLEAGHLRERSLTGEVAG